MDDLASAARLAGNFVQRGGQLHGGERRGLLNAVQAAGGIAGNRRQRLIQLVRQAGGQLAHGHQPGSGLQFFGLQTLALGKRPRLGDVGVNAQPGRFAIHPFNASAVQLIPARAAIELQITVHHIGQRANTFIVRPRQHHAERRVLAGAHHVFFKGAIGE